MTHSFRCLAVVLFLWNIITAHAQTIVSDNYNVTANGSGFALASGVNSGINPPSTRLGGTTAAGLRYIPTGTKTNTVFSISANKLRVTSATNPGRFTLSSDGITAFNFASAFGTATATPQRRAVYDLSISMANSSTGTQRFSFALGTSEGDATTWDFGIQLFRTATTDDFYTIGKRIDTGSSGLAADINTFITNTAPATSGTEVSFLMRVTDAGSETNSFNSRVQLSMDGGFTWFYDTDSDPDLPSGWRLNGAGRYVMWDIAPDAGPVTYDSFLISPVPVSATLVLPADGVTNIGAAPKLTAAVSNNNPENVTVVFYGHEPGKPYPGRDFVIPALPDTQNYAREASGSGQATMDMWYAQTDWIVSHRVSENIPFVATLGDCVQNGDIVNGNPNTTEWRNATNAMYRVESPAKTLLREGIPYGVTVGNHDQDPNGDPDGTTDLYNQYFGTSHFLGNNYYGGHFSTNNDSWFDLFSVSGLDFIVISFEYGRYGSTILDWANAVLATNQNRRVIVLTHHAGDDTPDDTTVAPFSAQGSAIYTALKANTNFFLMLGGHVFNEGGEGRRSDTYNGHTTRTLISDYQGRFNGGNGLMRLMYFSPSNNLVSVKTYSPYTDNYETDANSQFSFTYNMQPNGAGSPGTAYVAIGTNLNVASGTQTICPWPGLQANKTYEWYAKVTDASGNSFMTAPRRFTTTSNTAPIATNQSLSVIGDRATQITFTASDLNGDALTFMTNSRPLRGLNSDFDAAKGTITYLPARGYRGLDRFTFRVTDSVATSAIVNFDLTVTSPPDTNANGLPDSWEAAYGISDSNGDADGDGQSNLAEYMANTNPTNAASVLKIQGGVAQTNGSFGINWSSVGGTRYRIQYANGLTNVFTDLLRTIDTEMDPSPNGAASTQSFTDTSSATNSTRFYRIKVVP